MRRRYCDYCSTLKLNSISMSSPVFKLDNVSIFVENTYYEFCCLREFIMIIINKVLQKLILFFILIPVFIFLYPIFLISVELATFLGRCPYRVFFNSSSYHWLCLIFVIVTQIAVPLFTLCWWGYYYFEMTFLIYVNFIRFFLGVILFYGVIFILAGFIYFLMGKVFVDRDIVLIRLYYVFMAIYWILIVISFSFRVYYDLTHFDIFSKMIPFIPVAHCEANLSAINKSINVFVKSAVVLQQNPNDETLGLKIFTNMGALAEQLVLSKKSLEGASPAHIESVFEMVQGELLHLINRIYDVIFDKAFAAKSLPAQWQEYQTEVFRTSLSATYRNFIFYNPHNFPEVVESARKNAQFSAKLSAFDFKSTFDVIAGKAIKINSQQVQSQFNDLNALIQFERKSRVFSNSVLTDLNQFLVVDAITTDSSFSGGDEKDAIEFFGNIVNTAPPIDCFLDHTGSSAADAISSPQAVAENILISSAILETSSQVNAIGGVIPLNILNGNLVLALPPISPIATPLQNNEIIVALDEVTKKLIYTSLDKLSSATNNTSYLTRFWGWCFSDGLSDQEYITSLYSATDVKTQEQMLAGLDLPPRNPKLPKTYLFPEKYHFVNGELRLKEIDSSVKFSFDEGKFGISINDSHDARWQKFLVASGRK